MTKRCEHKLAGDPTRMIMCGRVAKHLVVPYELNVCGLHARLWRQRGVEVRKDALR